mmetsp:Transcript_10096/g.19415  ORF Transcript_10096/g.19415 Transcript_10096/m.19415 type:complete len:101 (-) Transcript_10096:307-609(-)|eukprot:scaffold16447_cov130-Amphora_coffeaeformis.AAC.1
MILKYQEVTPTAASAKELVDSTKTVATIRTKKQVQVLLCGCGNAVRVLIPYLYHYGQASTDYDFTVNVLSSRIKSPCPWSNPLCDGYRCRLGRQGEFDFQ